MRILQLFVCVVLISFTVVPSLFADSMVIWQATGDVEVRKEPSATSELLFRARAGTVLQQVDSSGPWIKVRDINSKTTGWIHKSSNIVRLSQSSIDKCISSGFGDPSCPIVENVERVGETGKPKNVATNIPPIVPPKGIPNRQEENSSLLLEQPSVSSIDLEQIRGSVYIATPEQLTAVKMSASDVNRIVCPTDIKDVVYSEEKGVHIKLVGKNAFVKFVIKRIGGKEVYSTIPVDLFVVCNDKVYNLIALPDKIPSVTVYLEDKESKIKEIVNKIREMPYEKRIVNYIREFLSGRIPTEATNVVVKKQYKIFEHLDITEISQHIIEGEGLIIRVFTVTANRPIDIRERDFLKKEITEAPVAISLDKLKLAQGEKAMLIIVERLRR